MKTAQELKDEYDENLKKIQSKCEHKDTTWCIEEWAPAHGTGWDVRSCKNCWKVLNRKTTCINCSKEIMISEEEYKSLDYNHPYIHHCCSNKCYKEYMDAYLI